MIINKLGAKYETEGKTFVIGEYIYTNEESDYRGLFGKVIEIRDGKDKETDNDTVDIYCTLDEPVLPFDKERLEKRFSQLYGNKMTLENIALDLVIFSPDMIIPVNSLASKMSVLNLFVIQEECCEDETSIYNYFFTDYVLAKQKFNEILAEDFNNGFVKNWKDKENFTVEHGKDYYEAWIDGMYCEKHYKVTISKEIFVLSEETYKKIGETYIDELLRSLFKEQTEQWDGLGELDDVEYEKLLNSKDLPHRIKEKLESDEAFLEKFWETFSSLCFDIIREKRRVKQ